MIERSAANFAVCEESTSRVAWSNELGLDVVEAELRIYYGIY